MHSLIPESRYQISMVAEPALSDSHPWISAPNDLSSDCVPGVGVDDGINMIAADPATPFDPVESERRVKELIAETVNKAFEALRSEIKAEMIQLSAKFDTVKAAQDLNDDYVKQTVDGNITKIWETINTLTDGITQMSTKMSLIDAAVTGSPPGINLNGGITNSLNGTLNLKSIMENKSVQNLEKLTSSPGDWTIWQLRLKNALSQVDEMYEYIIDTTETITRPISSYATWEYLIAPNIATGCGKTEEEINKLKRDMYTVLVDKCTSSQVLAFENDARDGIYAYYSLYRGFRLTAGLGQIEKREFLTRPPTAKSEAEVYDCIISWEREVKEQEKLVPAVQRPILSKTIKGAVLKNIAVGNIREYIKTHEAIKDYDVLREEVLQMAMFNRTENNLQATKPVPMDLNAIMEKLKGQTNQSPTKMPETDFNFGEGKGLSNSPNLNKTPDMSEIDKFVAEINAMMKGKGKGKSGVTCHNCGKTGHYAKDCWAAKKGDLKGYSSKGQGYWANKGEEKGGGKGGKGGCFNCGGPHWVRDCPKGKGKGKGGKGVNGVDGDGAINDGLGFPGLELGGGKGADQAQVEWDYQQEMYGENWPGSYSIEYDAPHDWINAPVTSNTYQNQAPSYDSSFATQRIKKPMSTMAINMCEAFRKTCESQDCAADCACDGNWTKVDELNKAKINRLKSAIIDPAEVEKINRRIDMSAAKVNDFIKQSENVIMNVKGEWERITFTGDSGAVDHVITKETGSAFEVNETAASKAGFGFRAANGTPIKIYGERRLNGVTAGGEAFKMNCQVTDVKKNLASFVKMVNEGNDIIMSKKGSFIKNTNNGKVIKLDLEKGTPQFDVWVKKAASLGQFGVLNVDGEADIDESAFHRLEMCI